MIELRWASKYDPVAYHDNGQWAVSKVVKVLQYRWNKALVGINTGTWSEWQEVPESSVFIHPPSNATSVPSSAEGER